MDMMSLATRGRIHSGMNMMSVATEGWNSLSVKELVIKLYVEIVELNKIVSGIKNMSEVKVNIGQNNIVKATISKIQEITTSIQNLNEILIDILEQNKMKVNIDE